jgi:hypothetical protein
VIKQLRTLRKTTLTIPAPAGEPRDRRTARMALCEA